MEYKYDDEGEWWPYFVLAILSFVVGLVAIQYVHRIVSSKEDVATANKSVKGSINEDSDSLDLPHKEAIGVQKGRKMSNLIFNKTLAFLIVGTALIIVLVVFFTKEMDLSTVFDPYTILDVSVTASEKEIKAKYRKLSLQYHPDKVARDLSEKGKEEMEALYIRITNAYKALTDEVTRENFLKYGHPDGKQMTVHGIAIPQHWVEGKYSWIFVGMYFIAMGIFMPIIVGRWWDDVKSHTKRGIHVDTAAMFVRNIATRVPGRLIAPFDIIRWCIESEEIKTLLPNLSADAAFDLVKGYLNRSYDDSIAVDTLSIVSKLPNLIDALLEISVLLKSVDIPLSALEAKRAIIAAVKPTGKHQDLLQLPYVDAKTIEAQPIKRLGKLLALERGEIKKVLGVSDDAKLDSILKIATHIPVLRILKAEFRVPGENIVPPGAACHVAVNFLVKSAKLKSCPEIEDERFKEDESLDLLINPLKTNEKQPELPYACSPYYPEYIRNNWSGWLFQQSDGKVIDGSSTFVLSNMDLSNLEITQEQWKAGNEGDVVLGSFKVPFTQPTPQEPGNYHFRLILKNNAYYGCDIDIPITMTVENAPPRVNKEKLRKLMGESEETDEDSDSDSDISDPEEDSLAGALAAMRGQSTKKSSKIEEVLSDDDEEDSVSDNESVFTDINTDTEDEGEIEESKSKK